MDLVITFFVYPCLNVPSLNFFVGDASTSYPAVPLSFFHDITILFFDGDFTVFSVTFFGTTFTVIVFTADL